MYGITNGLDGIRPNRPNGSAVYTYDQLNRITSAHSPTSDCTVLPSGLTKDWGQTFTVDIWGNLTNIAVERCSAPMLSVAVNTKNQIVGYTWDAAGNLISTGTHTYAYDAENRMTAVDSVTYTYDGDGKRVKKSTGTLYWTGAGSDALAESDVSGNIQREFIFLNGRRIARLDLPSAVVHYYFSDHLGSSNVVTNATGSTIEEESDFYPFGGERPVTDLLDQHYKFTGKERDPESGLDYFGARYFSSSLGRFITPDWAAKPTAVPYANFGNPQSLNLYSYVQNNPTTTGDPDGHCPILALCLAAARYVRNWAAKGIAQEGGKQFAKDAGIGHAKGVGSFAYHAALSSPAGMIAEHLVKEPKALSPTNEVQAGAKNITTGILVVGSLLVSAALSGPTAAETLANRAQEIHGALDPIAQTMRTTAVADAINADGSTARLVSSSEASLSPAQRAVLSPGETPVSGPGHAEETIMNSAQQNGQTVTTMGVSRTPCQGCAQTLKDAGVDVRGPKE